MTEHEMRELTAFLQKTPGTLRQLVTDLEGDDLRRKPSENEFSVLEHVCHLQDIEREGYAVRIRKLLGETRPFLPNIDGERLARERDYNSQILDDALHAFTAAREDNLRAIRNLSPEQLNNSGTLENVGEITLEGVLLMMREHDEDHLQALRGLREQLSKGN